MMNWLKIYILLILMYLMLYYFLKKQYDLDKKNMEQKIENVDKKNT